MNTTNSNKIKARMIELNLKQDDVASYIGISKQSLNRKLNGKNELKVSEINKMCRILRIKDISSYFFLQ